MAPYSELHRISAKFSSFNFCFFDIDIKMDTLRGNVLSSEKYYDKVESYVMDSRPFIRCRNNLSVNLEFGTIYGPIECS